MTATALLLLVPLSATAEPAIDEAKLTAWVADLSSPNHQKRLNAVTALTKAGPKAKPAVPALVKLLDPKGVHYFDAAEVLAAVGPGAKDAVPALLALLPTRPEGLGGYGAERIAWALAKIDRPRVEGTRALLITSGKCTPIFLTASATLRDYTPQVVSHLVELCADQDANVRARAATVIATLKEKDGGKVPGPTLYEKAGDSVKAIPAALEKMLGDDDVSARVAAAKAVTHVTPELTPRALTALVALAEREAAASKGELFNAVQVFMPVPDEAAKVLLPLFGHDDDAVRGWAITHVAWLPIHKQITDALANGKTARTREAAALTFGTRGANTPEVTAALKAALSDADFLVRFAAAQSLVKVAGRDPVARPAVPVLIEALEGRDELIRAEAGVCLQRLGADAKEATPALKKLLADKRFEVRLESALALVEVNPKQAAGGIPVLIEAVKLGDMTAARAARALAGFGPVAKDAVPELVKHFGSKNHHLRLRSAEAAARIDPAQAPKAVEVIVGLLRDPKYGRGMIRSYSLVALARIGPGAKDALPALAELLKDDGPFHADVARTMIALNPDAANPAYEWVRGVLNEKNGDEDGYDLMERLPELGAGAGPLVPELVKLLGSKTPFFRENAVRTLAAVGPGAKEALPALKKLAAEEKREDIRELATEAVKKIEGK